MKINRLIAATLTIITLAVMTIPVSAEETDAPLRGLFPYTMISREVIDKRLADDWIIVTDSGDPYQNVGTAVPFANNIEWSQVNSFIGTMQADPVSSSRILVSLAGLTPSGSFLYNAGLVPEEEAVKQEVIKYLNSYDWKNASEDEKARYTAQYIQDRCVYDAQYNCNKMMTNNAGELAEIVNKNTTYACLVQGRSGMDGFVQTYHLLTRAVGLKSIRIYSMYLNSSYNYVNLGGEWYKIGSLAWETQDSMNASEAIKIALANPAEHAAEDIRSLQDRSEEWYFDDTLPTEPSY